MSAPLANIIGLLKTHRYAVLAGTMLSALALPQWTTASDTARAGAIASSEGTIILAQQETPEQRRLRELKSKQAPQKGGPAPVVPGQKPPVVQQNVQPQNTAPVQNVQPKTLPKVQPRTVQPTPQPNVLEKNVKPNLQPKTAPVVVQPGRGQPQPGGQPVVGQPPVVGPGRGQPQPGAQPVVGQPPVVGPGRGQPQPGAQPVVGQPPVVGPGRGQPQPGGQPVVNQPPVVGPGRFPQKGGPAVVVGRPGPVPVNVENLRDQRRERREPGGRIVVTEPGGRLIVRDRGQVFIRHDDALRFSRFGQPVVTRRGLETFNVVRRPGGFEVITVTDARGNLLRRVRRGPDGREVILIDNRPRIGPRIGVGAAVIGAGLVLGLAAPIINMPRERYIVDVSGAPPELLVETLMAPPVMAMERPYTLDEIRYNAPLRDRMARVDIDTITFATGSWEVTPEQYPALEAIAQAILAVIEKNPNEVFMIEGHTDGVGNPDDNLSLSDRRAESVAVILTETYMVPPENLVTQGYGAEFLKIPTQEAERRNRRVAIRRVTPALLGQAH